MTIRNVGLITAALAALCLASAAGAVDLKRRLAFDIPPQKLSTALLEFSHQAGVQVVIGPEVGDRTTAGIKGTFTLEHVLSRLLESSQLKYSIVGESSISVGKPVPAAGNGNGDATDSLRLARVAQVGPPVSAATANPDKQAESEDSKGVPEILVKGRRTLNADIERTEDAPQPYVVFGREEIQRSQAANLDEFLKTRLSMNTTTISPAQGTGSPNTVSAINLRGLGTNQTLILVDGRRIPEIATNGFPSQPDINGIPLSAIERIEVLPSTAGGIYGGSATGGVINVILKRDFKGVEVKGTYANAFDTDVGNLRLDANAGFSLEDGRTRIMFTASRSQANTLLIGDRDFGVRAIALQEKNNRAAFFVSTTPPLGATVNIRAVTGNLVLDPQYGGRALNSNATYIPLGYAGPASDNGNALLANAGQYNLQMPAGILGTERSLVAAPGMKSASLNVRREFGKRVEAFLDVSRLGNGGGSFTVGGLFPNSVLNMPANAPNNPFQQAINVRFPIPGLSFPASSESTTLRGTGGVIARLPGSWTAELDYGWSRSRSAEFSAGSSVDFAGMTSLRTGLPAPDGRPMLNALQEGNTFPIDFTPYLVPPSQFSGPYDSLLQDGTLRLSGPTLSLPGGPLAVSALLERRKSTIDDAIAQSLNLQTLVPIYSFFPRRFQDTDSYYVETRTPLVSARNALSWVRELELQASVRYDKYRTRSIPTASINLPQRDSPVPPLNYRNSKLDSTDYTFALRYSPIEDVALRASIGTGFLPPTVAQIAPNQITTPISLGIDSRRGNTNMYVGVPFVNITGGNPELKPEISDSASAGLIYTPRFLSDLRLSLDYTRIDKVDEIQSPNFFFLVSNEDVLPGRVVRGPKLAGDPADWAGPITSINQTLINVAKTSVEAVDIQADYLFHTERLGEFHGYVLATRMLHFKNQLLPTTVLVDSVGFAGGPGRWRGNVGVDWDRGPFILSWNAQHYGSYWVYGASSTPASTDTSILSQGSARIPDQTYHDLLATYRFDGQAGMAWGSFADSEISIGIQNVFDKSPPILATTTPSSLGYSGYGDPRMRRYTVAFRKNFASR